MLISFLGASTVNAEKIRGTVDVIKASYGSADVIFSVKSDKDYKLSCAGAKRFGFDASQPGGANIYAALLGAQSSGNPVKVVTNDANPCIGSENVQAIKHLVLGTEKEDKDEDFKEYQEKMKDFKR